MRNYTYLGMKTSPKPSVVSVLREQEKKRQLKFWEMLLHDDTYTEPKCPTTSEAPKDSIYFGLMPRELRAAFVKSIYLRKDGHTAEARVMDTAISDLLQEHFKELLQWKASRGEAPIAEFRVTKDWHVYAIPFRHLPVIR